MVYKRGTPEYDRWKATPTYDLWRARISVAHKDKSRSDETKQKISTTMKGRSRSEETKQKISITMRGRSDLSGSNNPSWRGGVSFDPYPVDWTAHLRETIRKRDNYICILCRKTQDKRRLEVHHIDYDKQNLCLENLISLCTGCHQKTNGNREYWEKLFQMLYVPNFPKRRTENESCCR